MLIEEPMKVRFWGVRGSYPVPGVATNRYGGNTSCVEVCPMDGTTLIIDAGTGLRKLGQDLMSGPLGRGEGICHLLISHTHWDHIQGLPFFAPLYVKGNRINIYGRQRSVHLKDIFCSQTEAPYFTVNLDEVAADISYHELQGGTDFTVEGSRVRCARLNHPSIALGYRVEAPTGTVAYISDTAPFDRILFQNDFIAELPSDLPTGAEKESLEQIRQGVVDLCRGCDLVIFDTMFRPQEYLSRPHWGHSTAEQALELVEEAGARALVLFHYSPDHDDAHLDSVVAEVQQQASVEVIACTEGMEISISGDELVARPGPAYVAQDTTGQQGGR